MSPQDPSPWRAAARGRSTFASAASMLSWFRFRLLREATRRSRASCSVYTAGGSLGSSLLNKVAASVRHEVTLLASRLRWMKSSCTRASTSPGKSAANSTATAAPMLWAISTALPQPSSCSAVRRLKVWTRRL